MLFYLVLAASFRQMPSVALRARVDSQRFTMPVLAWQYAKRGELNHVPRGKSCRPSLFRQPCTTRAWVVRVAVHVRILTWSPDNTEPPDRYAGCPRALLHPGGSCQLSS